MKKLGFDYQELVALVVASMNPGATIRTNEWVEGPDGKREIDIEVRGTRNGKPQFTLIECKDYTHGKRRPPVDIEIIDQLDSKRRDLNADETIIFSNTGFTKKAVKKAGRVGIQALSALVYRDKRVKLRVSRLFNAKRTSVIRYQPTLYPDAESEKVFPDEWRLDQLYFQDAPFINWLHEFSVQFLKEVTRSGLVGVAIVFRQPTSFKLKGTNVNLRGVGLTISITVQWLRQKLTENVSTGYYDHINNRVTIPPKQWWSLGPIDMEAWEELNSPPSLTEKELTPNSFDLKLEFFEPVAKLEGEGTPDLDPHIDRIVAEYLE